MELTVQRGSISLNSIKWGFWVLVLRSRSDLSKLLDLHFVWKLGRKGISFRISLLHLVILFGYPLVRKVLGTVLKSFP